MSRTRTEVSLCSEYEQLTIVDRALWSGLHDVFHPEEGLGVPPHEADKDNLARLLLHALDLVRALNAQGHRLLDEDILACPKRLDGLLDVVLAVRQLSAGESAYSALMTMTRSMSSAFASMSSTLL